ncbi:sulfotransferase 16, CORONATINE INDUCED-7, SULFOTRANSFERASE 16, ARABIDOPSIS SULFOTRANSFERASE 5A [Hibiscus trionum]|uniref:Sulfotransferase n=1 Tax=Hibiscus trionum TaxID=183268 RepID=A0A9W7MGV8_HIBTR|nr:sulfotransferase 16, CORONATINE INDUCED-7, SULFOTRANSFERASE 16, ARABIDOPSIS SULFOTRANSFERASE 5A [Hibiscus trionum]
MELQLDSISKPIENQKEDEFEKSFKEIISTLPKSNGWGVSKDLCQYQGFWLHPNFLRGVVAAQQRFQAQPTDIILCSVPKAGTTWLKSLTFATISRTSFDDSTTPLLSNMPHEIVPFMELHHAQFFTNKDRGIPLLSTHIPYPSLPRSVIDSGCKLVYICRDPKDSFVSMYHFIARNLTSRKVQPLGLDEAFELFCEGQCFYGPYWDHVLGYWKASLEHPDKILFLKYEEMRGDTVVYVKKLAEFINYPFSSEEQENGVPEKIVKMCSFEKLSNLEVNKTGVYGELGTGFVENKTYFRKGEVGDWKNCLTPEMAARLDQITMQKLSGSGLSL